LIAFRFVYTGWGFPRHGCADRKCEEELKKNIFKSAGLIDKFDAENFCNR